MERTKWVDRKFTFDIPEGWIYNILKRLRGTEARIRNMTSGISEEMLQSKKHGKWRQGATNYEWFLITNY